MDMKIRKIKEEEWMGSRHPAEGRDGIRYIKNPYSREETERVMEWINRHPADPASLAVAMWFTGGLAPQEIINLRPPHGTEWDSLQRAGGWRKAELVQRAMALYREEPEFVFMGRDGSRWKKLNGNCLQIKLYNICRKAGITYRKIHMDEAILGGK